MYMHYVECYPRSILKDWQGNGLLGLVSLENTCLDVTSLSGKSDVISEFFYQYITYFEAPWLVGRSSLSALGNKPSSMKH